MAAAFESNDAEESVSIPPILALPCTGLENELRRVESVEVIFHSVLTGASAGTGSKSSCLWHFVVQTASNTLDKDKRKRVSNGHNSPVILATAVLNADEDGLCGVFRGNDQQPLPIYFQFPSIPKAPTNADKGGGTPDKCNVLCHWKNLDGDLVAVVNLNSKSSSATLDGVHGRNFGRLTAAKRAGNSRPALACGQMGVTHSTHSFESEMLPVAGITHLVYKDRSNSNLPYFEANEVVDKIVYRIDFAKDSNVSIRSACVGFTLALACQDAMLYFNPTASAKPPKTFKAKRSKSTAPKPTTTL